MALRPRSVMWVTGPDNSGSKSGFEALRPALALALGQLGKGGKWALIRLSVLRRLENGAGFAGIGIEAENQELGRERSQVDHTADQRLRIAPFHIARFGFSARLRRGGPLRNESQIDRLLDFTGERLQRDDTVLPDRGRNETSDVQAADAAARHLEFGMQARPLSQAPHPSHLRAGGVFGNEIELLAALGDIGGSNGNVPRRRRRIPRFWISGFLFLHVQWP